MGKRIHVTPSGGGWRVKPEKGQLLSQHPTQREAERAAKEHLRRQPDGGEVIIHRPDGRIRDSDTINRPDPNPPTDTQH